MYQLANPQTARVQIIYGASIVMSMMLLQTAVMWGNVALDSIDLAHAQIATNKLVFDDCGASPMNIVPYGCILYVALARSLAPHTVVTHVLSLQYPIPCTRALTQHLIPSQVHVL
jgi:hypothetical protein